MCRTKVQTPTTYYLKRFLKIGRVPPGLIKCCWRLGRWLAYFCSRSNNTCCCCTVRGSSIFQLMRFVFTITNKDGSRAIWQLIRLWFAKIIFGCSQRDHYRKGQPGGGDWAKRGEAKRATCDLYYHRFITKTLPESHSNSLILLLLISASETQRLAFDCDIWPRNVIGSIVINANFPNSSDWCECISGSKYWSQWSIIHIKAPYWKIQHIFTHGRYIPVSWIRIMK